MEKSKEDNEEEERSIPKEKSIEALEDFARGIIKCFTKLPENKCGLCEEGGEDLKSSLIRCKDEVAALEALALRMLEWRRPDGALKRRKYSEGYDSLVEQRHVAMKYHGLDVDYKE